MGARDQVDSDLAHAIHLIRFVGRRRPHAADRAR